MLVGELKKMMEKYPDDKSIGFFATIDVRIGELHAELGVELFFDKFFNYDFPEIKLAIMFKTV